MTHTMISLQGLHLGNAFRCPNVSASMELKPFCQGCLKLGRDTKQLPSTSGRYIIGWQSCVTYARHLPACLHRASLAITEDARQNVAWNVQSAKGPQKSLRKRSLRDIRRHPSCMIYMLSSSHKEWNVALPLPSSQAGEFKSVHPLNHSQLSQTHFQLSLHSVK